MEKILAVGDRETILGFAIAGVEGIAAKEDAEELVLGILSEKDEKRKVGLLIIQEDVLRKFSAKSKRLIDNISKPVVVSIPSKFGTSLEDGEDFAKMVKKAIGIELK